MSSPDDDEYHRDDGLLLGSIVETQVLGLVYNKDRKSSSLSKTINTCVSSSPCRPLVSMKPVASELKSPAFYYSESLKNDVTSFRREHYSESYGHHDGLSTPYDMLCNLEDQAEMYEYESAPLFSAPLFDTPVLASQEEQLKRAKLQTSLRIKAKQERCSTKRLKENLKFEQMAAKRDWGKKFNNNVTAVTRQLAREAIKKRRKKLNSKVKKKVIVEKRRRDNAKRRSQIFLNRQQKYKQNMVKIQTEVSRARLQRKEVAFCEELEARKQKVLEQKKKKKAGGKQSNKPLLSRVLLHSGNSNASPNALAASPSISSLPVGLQSPVLLQHSHSAPNLFQQKKKKLEPIKGHSMMNSKKIQVRIPF